MPILVVAPVASMPRRWYQKFGINVVIAESFAEIFHGNCTTLGIPCLQMAAEPRSELARLIEAEPGEELMVDLEPCKWCI